MINLIINSQYLSLFIRQQKQLMLQHDIELVKADQKSVRRLSKVGDRIIKSQQKQVGRNKKRKHNTEQSIEKQQIQLSPKMSKDQKIQKMVDQLYPKIDGSFCQISRKKSSLLTYQNQDDKNNILLNDSYASQRKFQNKVSLNNAQRQLDKRIKNRVLQKAKKINHGINQSYTEIYKKLKTQRDYKNRIELLQIEESPKQKYGVNYYQELKIMPNLLKYTKQKIDSKKMQRGFHLSLNKTSSNHTLESLSVRKRKKTLQEKRDFQQKWVENIYNQQISNISQISSRLKRIYSRGVKLNMNDQQLKQIQKSKILQHQKEILQYFNQNPQKITVRNKEKLIDQFNRILNEYGRSLVSRKAQPKLNYQPFQREKQIKLKLAEKNNSQSEVRVILKRQNNLKNLKSLLKNQSNLVSL